MMLTLKKNPCSLLCKKQMRNGKFLSYSVLGLLQIKVRHLTQSQEVIAGVNRFSKQEYGLNAKKLLY
jgi:hypothetical protein